MNKIKIFFIILISIFTLLTKTSFANQTNYNCVFDKGSNSDFDSTPRAASVKDTLNVDFKDLDFEKGVGIMRGNNGETEVNLVIRSSNVHIIEVTGLSNITVTTIFTNLDTKYNAVHSRHMDLIGTAVVSQYYGICN